MKLTPLCILHLVFSTAFGLADGQREPPVERVASHTFSLMTARGAAEMLFDESLDWNQPQPQVIRAVVMFHGKSRDVDGYYRSTLQAVQRAGEQSVVTSLLIAPQFINEDDASAHHLPDNILRWRQGTWEGGAEALGPVSVSAYEVIDAIVTHLADSRLYPNLKTIVLAGHSGGGQAIQRYAIVGKAEEVVGSSIHLRYVIANPSSYLYFDDERPQFNGSSFIFRTETGSSCHNFDHWRFGPLGANEKYVRKSAKSGWQELEEAYARKDVVYLLGTADIDPREKDLDVSCAGEMEGPTRFLRGQAYYDWLHKRHVTDWNQRLWLVQKVAHSAGKMFTSECGVAALFEWPTCQDH